MQEEEEAPAFVIKKRTKPRSSLVSKLSTSSDSTSAAPTTSSALEGEEDDGNVPVIRSRGKKTPAGRVKARESGAAAARGRISFGGDDDGDEAGVSRSVVSTRREEEARLMYTGSGRARAGRFGNQFRRQEVLERFFLDPAPLVAPVCCDRFQYRFSKLGFVILSRDAVCVRLVRKNQILRRRCRRREHLLERVSRRAKTKPIESAQAGERGGDGRSITGGVRLADPEQVWGGTTPRWVRTRAAIRGAKGCQARLVERVTC